MELKDKKAMIIGASRGIGEAIAIAFSSAGADVLLVGRKEVDLLPVAEKIRAAGGRAYTLVWDIMQVEKADETMLQAGKILNGLDIIVNNAGVIEREAVLQVKESTWDYVMNVNLKGTYFSCQAAANYFLARKQKGKILNIASETAFQPAPTPYGISKWGVVGFSMGLAKRLYKQGISLSVIAPGPIATDMMNWQEGKSDAFPNAFGTLGSPKEVADLAVFLASEKGDRLIGRPVFVSGGLDW